jgi:hypothetical protein
MYVYEWINAFFSTGADIENGRHQFPILINLPFVCAWAQSCAKYARKGHMGLIGWLRFSNPKNW